MDECTCRMTAHAGWLYDCEGRTGRINVPVVPLQQISCASRILRPRSGTEEDGDTSAGGGGAEMRGDAPRCALGVSMRSGEDTKDVWGHAG